jgi:HNH endonuclease
MPGYPGMKMHVWHPEYLLWLAENRVKYFGAKQLTEDFNKIFETNFSEAALKSACLRNKIKTGRHGWEGEDGKYRIKAPEKGARRSPKTEFKKGQRNIRQKEIGSERIERDGYKVIKVSEPNKWKYAHVILWESHNGDVPKSHVVFFLDGNKENITLENLVLVSRAELSQINRSEFSQLDISARRAFLTMIKLNLKVNQLSKK